MNRRDRPPHMTSSFTTYTVEVKTVEKIIEKFCFTYCPQISEKVKQQLIKELKGVQ